MMRSCAAGLALISMLPLAVAQTLHPTASWAADRAALRRPVPRRPTQLSGAAFGPHPEADQKPGEASAVSWPMGGALRVANKTPSKYSEPVLGWACA